MQLQHDLEEHSPVKVHIPTEEQMRESRKNMIGNIDYIMTYGNVTGNPETSEIWEQLEMTIQDFQVAGRKIILGTSKQHREQVSYGLLLLLKRNKQANDLRE